MVLDVGGSLAFLCLGGAEWACANLQRVGRHLNEGGDQWEMGKGSSSVNLSNIATQQLVPLVFQRSLVPLVDVT